MLGKWAVNCYQPNCDVFSFGVISPVSLNATIAELETLMSTNKWAVNCYQPNSDVFSFGVISPVSLNAIIAELETLMSTNNLNCKIVKIQRLKRRNGVTWEDSASLKITFTGTVKV